MKVRTRFAPSPTGYIHIGNVRTALFAFLVARSHNGQFILRLEDTDQKREVDGSDAHIIKTLHTLNIVYNEGPDIGGQFAPYRQSERLDSYKKWAYKLIEKGRAYVDPYSPEQLQKFRNECMSAKKPFRYRDYRPENPPPWDGTQPLRFKSEPRDYSWNDEVMGNLSASSDAIDDFILIKSDGFPTYNFAHIVDDIEMKISHVIRGQEFNSSMPNYLNLYDALDIKWPIFAHLPHILSENGNKKLGKRDGAKDVLEYLQDGILVEAMNNYIASMGWNDGTEQEIFSMDELIAKFALNRVGRSGALFDEKRLIWLNGQWIKKLNFEDLFARCENFWGKSGENASEIERRKVLGVVHERLKTLVDLPNLSEYFFARPNPNWQLVDENKQLKKLSRNEQIKLLILTKEKLLQVSEDKWHEEDLQDVLNELLIETSSRPSMLFGVIRFALTWAKFSPGLPETMTALGKAEALARIDLAIK